MSGLAAILGQVFGGFLLAANLFNMGWRSIFLVNVPIGIVALLAAFSFLRESRSHLAQDLDYGGVTLLTLSLFLLVFPLVQGGNAGWPWWTLICLFLSVPFLVAFLAYEQRMTKRERMPLISLTLFQERRFPSGLLKIAQANALFAVALLLLAFYLQTILQFTPLQAGLVIMDPSLAFILAARLNPLLAPRLGKQSLPVAAGLVTMSYLLLGLAAQWLVPLWGLPPLLAALFVLGFGMGSLVTPLPHKTLEGVVEQEVGTASGVYATVSQTA